jgi:hypothetical protein
VAAANQTPRTACAWTALIRLARRMGGGRTGCGLRWRRPVDSGCRLAARLLRHSLCARWPVRLSFHERVAANESLEDRSETNADDRLSVPKRPFLS